MFSRNEIHSQMKWTCHIWRHSFVMWKISLKREFAKLFHSIMDIRVSKWWWHFNSQHLFGGIFLDYLLTTSSRCFYYCTSFALFIHISFHKKFESWGLKKFSHPVDEQAVIFLALACIGKWMHIFTCLTKLRNLQVC